MQTSFTLAQLADPNIAEADHILRTCVHCGFCTATCPTYVLLGDELDSPRGRIYLIKDMLENDRPATADVVKHIDRCLSCLACMTTCPSGVHYMHLVDHARAHIESTYVRPPIDRLLRAVLARVLPDNRLLRWALGAARLGKPFAGLFAALGLGPVAAMLRLAPARLPGKSAREGRRLFPPQRPRRGRVALLTGCVAPVIAPSISAAAIRLLTRHGIEVVVADEGCCGSLVHHMGRTEEALAAARRQIDAWSAEIEGEGLDAILVTASGCGTTVKDYGFMLRTDRAYADKAARVSGLARDISEYLTELELTSEHRPPRLVVAYHSACSLQHGQKVGRAPKELLSKIGFVVKDVPEGHLCCGSAGTYNILEPELARRLRERKVGNIEKLEPDVIAAGNIGCMTQIAAGTAIPVIHTVELIDWATGGPAPQALTGKEVSAAAARTVAAAM
jgi:glycolate oxidase iron-sulfur subunit